MSVTFELQDMGPLTGHTVLFWCDNERLTIEPGRERSEQLATEHSTTCPECNSYGGPMIEDNFATAPLNLSNGNAAMILRLLGYVNADNTAPSAQRTSGDLFTDSGEVQMFGHDNAEQFLGRVLVALGLEPEDEGRPTITTGNFIECGTETGYKQKKLRALHDLATIAKERQTAISWG